LLFRDGKLTTEEFTDRLQALEALAEAKLKPEIGSKDVSG